VVDCRRLRFCGGAGLRALTTLSNEVLPRGSVSIVSAPRSLRRHLEATGLATRFVLVDDLDPPRSTPPSGLGDGSGREVASR
jgi:anti-anti-sigma regulatory factor